MNEELLCAAIFERAITDYEKAIRFICHPHGSKIEAAIAKARYRMTDVRSFSTGPEAMLYAGGSEKVIRCLAERLDEIDRRYKYA